MKMITLTDNTGTLVMSHDRTELLAAVRDANATLNRWANEAPGIGQNRCGYVSIPLARLSELHVHLDNVIGDCSDSPTGDSEPPLAEAVQE
jgi:hypothetical protein